MLLAAALLLAAAGCGSAHTESGRKSEWPTVTVSLSRAGGLATTPFWVAEKLGFFADNHIAVRIANGPHPDVRIAPAGEFWPAVGYIGIRPDLLLVSPMADPSFRLRSLNQLPMVIQKNIAPDRTLADKIFLAHHAQISRWSTASAAVLDQIWKAHHLPWVLVTLGEAIHLTELDPHTSVLAWLGASTGPVPATVITASKPDGKTVRFLDAINLALWYLHTTPPAQVATGVNGRPTDGRLTRLVHQALHLQVWPATTFPDRSTFDRRRALWNPNWPPYDSAVNPGPGRQALADSGK